MFKYIILSSLSILSFLTGYLFANREIKLENTNKHKDDYITINQLKSKLKIENYSDVKIIINNNILKENKIQLDLTK